MTDHYLIETLQAQGFEVKAPEDFDASKLDEVIENAPQIEGLRSGLNRVKSERDQFKQSLTDQQAAAEQAKRERLEAEGKFEELRELDRQELSNLQGSLVTQRAESLKQQTIGKFSQDVDLIQYAVSQHVKPAFENGQVVDKFEFNGNQYNNFDDYFKALSSNEQFASKIKAPASSGAQPSGGQGQHAVTKRRSQMTAEEKTAFVREHSREDFLRLPK
ncbi:coil containing protein [Vibrio phage 1.178.O._10N.286.45.E12]|nr:coil containing protein [Vibrio phage 1.178.O._10N.286.45.E12]